VVIDDAIVVLDEHLSVRRKKSGCRRWWRRGATKEIGWR